MSSYVAFHPVTLGVLSWVLGQRFLLPSLGPSVFALATLSDHEMHVPRRFVGGQVIAAVSAFLAAHLFLPSSTSIGGYDRSRRSSSSTSERCSSQ